MDRRTSSIRLKSHRSVDCEFEEDDDLFTKEMINYAKKAEHDHLILSELLRSKSPEKIFIDEKGARLEFLKDPTGWIRKYSLHTRRFAEDDHYIGYLVGLLEITVDSCPYGEDRHDIYTPILLLQKMISVNYLIERRDPMRTALKLQHYLKEYARKENDGNSLYDRKIEELEKIPSDFALQLMNACITPVEVAKLMQIDDETMFLDVLKSENKQLVASKMYQKLVWQEFWGLETSLDKNADRTERSLYLLRRLGNFFFWNLFYLPLAIMSQYSTRVQKTLKRTNFFFSPFSYYFADLLNYCILLAILLIVTITTVPNPEPVHLLIKQLQAGNISVENNDHFKVDPDGSILVKLPTPNIPLAEWSLWVCIFSRVLTESYQAYQKKGTIATSKLKKYFQSFFNLNDVALMLLLLIGIICKLHMYISSRMFGVYRRVDDHNMVARSLILTIQFYNIAAVMALVHLLEVCTIHVAGLGPLLRAIREMSGEIYRVLFLLIFFLVGFIAPMFSLGLCYRVVHGIDGTDGNDDFYSFKSFSNTVLSLIWSLFEGMAYNQRESLYNSTDSGMTAIMGFLLIVYQVLLCIMSMNLLIAIMCDVYSKVSADKFAEWRFSQFETIMDYNAVTNVEGHGMPFLFPICIPYIVFNLVTKSCKKRQLKIYTGKRTDNHFVKFLFERIGFEEEMRHITKIREEAESLDGDQAEHTSTHNHQVALQHAVQQ